MINLYMPLPDTVTVQGRDFLIKTDFRWWLLFDKIIKQDKINLKDLEYLFVDEVPRGNYLSALLNFYKNPNSTPKESNKKTDNVLDYQEDGEFIYASFLSAYGIDILDDNFHMHWHKFKALVVGLPQGVIMREIMSIRGWEPDNRKINDIHKDLKRIWSLPKVDEKEVLNAQKEFFD